LAVFALLAVVAAGPDLLWAAELKSGGNGPPSSVLESPLDDSEPLFPPPAVAVPPSEPGTDTLPASDGRDQLWLISTRAMRGYKPCPNLSDLRIQRHVCGQGWQSATLDEFLAADDPQMVTTIWIHGNDVPSERAYEQGLTMYQKLAGNTCKAVRLVIWSWPSDYVAGRVRNDVQLKFNRTDVEPFYLGFVLDRIRPDVPVVLIGYSFGARISTGALHLLGGGSIDNQILPMTPKSADRVPRRGILLAAAAGRDSLAPRHLHSEALSQVDRMVIMINPRDFVLKFFPVLADDGEEALGLRGPTGLGKTGDLRARVVLFKVTPYVHSHHALTEYQESPEIMACVRDEVFSAGPSTSVAPASQVTSSTADIEVANAAVVLAK
jgi:hypothetical protein